MDPVSLADARVRLPDVPALIAGVGDAVWLAPTGEVEHLSHREAGQRLAAGATPIVCHARATARRLAIAGFPAHDLLELFAFVRPARFCLPTPRGLAAALLLPMPITAEQEAMALFAAARALLAELTASPGDDAAEIAQAMGRAGWAWAPAVDAALAVTKVPQGARRRRGSGLRVWERLREWDDPGPAEPPAAWPVEAVEARAQLVRLLGAEAEPRPQQMDYASAAAAAFAPREREGEPRVVLAEAGTGIGKTLGYIAPASIWARKNHGSVWISTYTRNLQRQLDRELDRLDPNPLTKARRIVVRKGRENTFCLLNFDEAITRLPLAAGGEAVALGLVARWALRTRDGDMVGGDFPAWLADLLGRGLTTDLTDTRGECIYAACTHFRKCFIERVIRRARRAEIVVANHALVMVQAALGAEEQALPTRYVFDEGHHLFDAADSAFAADLSGMETAAGCWAPSRDADRADAVSSSDAPICSARTATAGRRWSRPWPRRGCCAVRAGGNAWRPRSR